MDSWNSKKKQKSKESIGFQIFIKIIWHFKQRIKTSSGENIAL